MNEGKRLRWIIGSLSLLLAAAGLGISYTLDGELGRAISYIWMPLMVMILVFSAALILRLRLFGLLPTDADSLFSPRILYQLKRWTIFKLSIVVAVVVLVIGSIISGISGAGIQHGIGAIIYLTLLMMLGNLVIGTLLNFDLVKKARTPRS